MEKRKSMNNRLKTEKDNCKVPDKTQGRNEFNRF